MNQDQKQEIMEQRLNQIRIISNMSEKINELLEAINSKADEYIELNKNLAYKDEIDVEMIDAVVRLQDSVVKITQEQTNIYKIGKRLIDFDNIIIDDGNEEEITDAEEVEED